MIGVRHIRLQIEILVGQDVPLDERRFSWGHLALGSSIGVEPHLGRTVSLDQTINLEEGFDPETVRREYDRFWDDGTAYARLHRGTFQPAPDRDWSQARFPSDFVLDRADNVSFARAAASWGFQPTEVWIEPTIGPSSNVDVDGTPVRISDGGFDGATGKSDCVLTANLRLPKGVDTVAWSKRHEKTIPGLNPYVNPRDIVAIEERIDMAKRVSLGELRRRVKTFATKAKALQASIRDAP